MNAPLKSLDHQPEIFGDVDNRAYPAPAEMLHISIAHSGPGIEDMIRFYQVVLNMRFVYKFSYPEFEFIALSHDDENHRIGILNNLAGNDDALAMSQGVDRAKDVAVDKVDEPRNAPLRQCRIEHTSWLYHSFEDVLATAERVHNELGIWPRTSRLQGYDITIDYNDPDGNRVELLSQYDSKAQILHRLHKLFSGELKDMKYSDVYQSFNMEKMLAMRAAGEPIENLRSKAWVKQKVAEGLL
jgi:catechol 2,3-dioxygenase-like lactoylglutathione lyase family enzyme